jgi:hypothetical protein
MTRGADMIWSAWRRCAIGFACRRPAGSVSIGSASRGANSALRSVRIVGLAVLAVMALGANPRANADPPPGCPQGPVPGPGPFPGCGNEGAFLADIGAAGFGDASGKPVALQQGRDICRLMDAGLSQQEMVNQFAALNPALGPDGAAQVVGIAIRDLCPWHR